MMDGYTKRCFESVAALQRLNPQVLRDLLATFPAFCDAQGIELPKQAAREGLDYGRIYTALMGNAVPPALDDTMYLASRLGHGSHWDSVEDQAHEDGRTIPSDAKLSYPDLAILLAIEDWPKHRLFLERANARSWAQGKSSFVYYAPSHDWRPRYRSPNDSSIAAAKEYLIRHFIDIGMVTDSIQGRATEILTFDHEKEIWFLIRYPGKIRRQGGADKSGNWVSYAYNPEQYDVVVYNKVYGDLRMNTHRKTEHVNYRVAFGRLLFGDDVMNAFRDKVQVVTLEPLLGERSAELFNAKDIHGLRRITPIEIRYEPFDLTGQLMTWASNGERSLLDGSPNGTRLLPEDVLVVTRMVVAYWLGNGHAGKLTIHQKGNRVNFERDGDSVVLEDWLRQRGFVKGFVKEFVEATSAIKAA